MVQEVENFRLYNLNNQAVNKSKYPIPTNPYVNLKLKVFIRINVQFYVKMFLCGSFKLCDKVFMRMLAIYMVNDAFYSNLVFFKMLINKTYNRY